MKRDRRLVWLIDGEVHCAGTDGPVRVAAEATVVALEGLRRLAPVDAAQVALFLSLAAAVDADPGNAALWREFRGAEADLRSVGGDGDIDALAELAAQFEAEMGDAEDA